LIGTGRVVLKPLAKRLIYTFCVCTTLQVSIAHAATLADGVEVQLALSEIKREELPPPGGIVAPPLIPVDPSVEIPSPEPIKPGVTPASPLDDVSPEPNNPDDANPEDTGADPARPNIDPNAPLPVVEYDLTKLPDAVREMHAKLVEAAKSGKIEALRALIGAAENQTQFSLGNQDEDPLTFLLSLSGDPGGQEILAILLEILDAGFIHLDAGTPQDLYVWPYFFAIPLDRLTDMQRVELFKIVTSGDVEDMKSFGSYIFYRAGISPDGKWRFFLAGE
jgi:hypothetical protein